MILSIKTVDIIKSEFNTSNFTGYQPDLKSCEAEETDYKMKKKERTHCKHTESRLKTCKYTCEETPEPTKEPGPEPTESPDPATPHKVVQKCSHENTNFPGADFFNKVYGSIEDCVNDCLRAKSCKSITYRELDGRCYFKSMDGGSSGPAPAVGYTSVNMKCDRSPKKMNCQRANTNFEGADLTSLVSAGIEECVTFCRDTENCKSITFLEASLRCYLKSQYGGEAGPVPKAGYTSMNMQCDNSPVNLDCLREGINFAGANINLGVVVTDVKECVRYCRDTENCVAFTVRGVDQQYCFLKSKRGGDWAPTKLADRKSMNMVCDNGPVKNLGCARQDFDFPGAHLGSLIVPDIKACVRYCRDAERCKALTYDQSKRVCYFKTTRGGAAGPRPRVGYKSINMECDNSKINNLNCLREGINFPGAAAEIGNVVVADVKECVRHCRDTENCVALTFGESENKCYLKSKRGGLQGPTKEVGYKSMNMVCDNSPVNNFACVREDFNFPGADVRNSAIIVPDIAECARLCRDTDGCKAVTFIEVNHYCYFKTRRGGNTPRPRAGYKSMNLVCDNSKVTNLNCLRKGLNFPGADLGNLPVADEEECVRQCRDTEDCVAFTFIESTKYCYLKSKRGGNYGPWRTAGQNSLNMECDNSKVDLSCGVEKENFAEKELRNIGVGDREECVRMCRDTEDCFSVSLTNNQCSLKPKEFEWWQITSAENYWSTNIKC